MLWWLRSASCTDDGGSHSGGAFCIGDIEDTSDWYYAGDKYGVASI